MDASTALQQTQPIVTGVIAGLTPEHKDMPTPCEEWSVHDLIEHMCQGGHLVALGLQDQAPPEEGADVLAEGPAAGWAAAAAALRAAATPEAVAATHELPSFGEVPGEVALSVITADHLVHAWDLAQATGQDLDIDDELAEWALQTWQVVVPADGRTGDGFADVVPVADDAPAVDRLLGYTGRQP
jgi:uncharacterized protein (TIGR03086 family)